MVKEPRKIRTCRYCGYPIRNWEILARDEGGRSYHPTCLALMTDRKEKYEQAQKKQFTR